LVRLGLFLFVNLLVSLTLGAVVLLFGLQPIVKGHGWTIGGMLVVSTGLGFGGGILSLVFARFWSRLQTAARVIETPENTTEVWLVETVGQYAERLRIVAPQVAIYPAIPNAYAVGAVSDSAMLALSSGLVQTLDRDEIEAVIAHEMAQIADGEMVTLTLVQGVLNTFVWFIARGAGYAVDRLGAKDTGVSGVVVPVVSLALFVPLGIPAGAVVAWYSRRCKFRGDARAAELMGRTEPLISALARLDGVEPDILTQGGWILSPAQFHGGRPLPDGWMKTLTDPFRHQPPASERIAALRAAR
jgi:heat shock protein HtpX